MHRARVVGLIAALLGGRAWSPALAQRDYAVTGTAIGGIRVCQPLDSVNASYPEARDTMLFGGASGIRWPGKVVSLDAGGRLFAEASWVDRQRVWRVSTTSPALATDAGLHVGSSIADVLAARERLIFTFPQGGLVLRMRKARIFFQVDDSSAARFRSRYGGAGDPLRSLDRTARIKEMFITGACRQGRAAGIR